MKGRSLVWNQLIDITATSTDRRVLSRCSVSITDNVATITQNDGSANFIVRWLGVNTFPSGHKILASFDYKTARTDMRAGLSYEKNASSASWEATTFLAASDSIFTKYVGIWNSPSSQYLYAGISFYCNTADQDNNVQLKNVQLIDLTQMFSAGNEPATVEEFEALYHLPYYDHNPGKIINNKTQSLEITGFNQWDEGWEEGDISSTNGQNLGAATCWRTKNYIPILPDTCYYIKATPTGSTTALRGRFYDADKNYIGYSPRGGGDLLCNTPFYTPINARYLRFAPNISTIDKGGQVCVNFSDPSRNGTYEPYKTNTIELNLPTLTGKLNGEGESVVVFPDGLKSAGTVYDEIVGNRAIKRIGVVDLGTLTWSYNSSFLYMQCDNYTNRNVIKGNSDAVANVVTPLYIPARNFTAVQTHSSDKIIAVSDAGRIGIYDSAYTDAATFKTAMSGVLLYYELTEPQVYILDTPLPKKYKVWSEGTEERLPRDTSSSVNAPVRYDVLYPEPED